jgi:hypothetical protein
MIFALSSPVLVNEIPAINLYYKYPAGTLSATLSSGILVVRGA